MLVYITRSLTVRGYFTENDVPTDVSDVQHNHWVKAHEMWRNLSKAHNRDVVTLGLLTALIDFLLQVSEGLQVTYILTKHKCSLNLKRHLE